jgi:hypothetical protein
MGQLVGIRKSHITATQESANPLLGDAGFLAQRGRGKAALADRISQNFRHVFCCHQRNITALGEYVYNLAAPRFVNVEGDATGFPQRESQPGSLSRLGAAGRDLLESGAWVDYGGVTRWRTLSGRVRS